MFNIYSRYNPEKKNGIRETGSDVTKRTSNRRTVNGKNARKQPKVKNNFWFLTRRRETLDSSAKYRNLAFCVRSCREHDS